MKTPEWFYNELELSGTDFHSLEEAERYMERVNKIQDHPAQAEIMAEQLKLKPDHIVMDIGSGPGYMALELTKYCGKVVGLDISDIMLDLARKRMKENRIENAQFLKGGFLNIPDEITPVDRIITQKAFHHLPDFWKQIALANVYKALKPGGLFLLDDVVFSFNHEDYVKTLDKWVEDVENLFGKDMRYSVMNHLSKEYSTFTWIMDGMLERAGFQILSKKISTPCFIVYICEKSGKK